MVKTIEILVAKNLGSDKLFVHYLFFNVEKKIHKFSFEQYSRLLMALADKQYVEDNIFWTDYMWEYLRKKEFREEIKPHHAKMIWDSLVFLKLKCPLLDISEVQDIVERHMEDDA